MAVTEPCSADLATDQVLDFNEARVDLALRPVLGGAASSDGALSERVLGQIHAGVYASPSYLERAGSPASLDDLGPLVRAAHAPTMTDGVTLHSSSGKRHRLELDQVRLWTTSHGQLLHATLQGATVGVLPTFLADPEVERGSLVRLFEPWRAHRVLIGLVYPMQQVILPKTRTLIDHISAHAVSLGLLRS